MMKMRRLLLALLLIVPLGIVLSFAGMSMFSKRPDDLGIHNGQLRDCPSSPNCVGTHASDETKRMPPLSYSGDSANAWQRLKEVIQSMPRMKIVTDDANYLHVEFTSFLFRFVDDVEFQLDDDKKVIHFRSASRVGHSDLGVNRERMATIQQRFEGASRTDQ
ncbi:MAG: DUF1499 domain-containing protein [Planctomycetaceae bacterium]|nr:DUF1499 domain-containing protein [Planctomycetaceae bacterium]